MGSTRIVALDSAATEREPVVGVTRSTTVLITVLTGALVRREGALPVGPFGGGSLTVPVLPTRWPTPIEIEPVENMNIAVTVATSGALMA
jgi:hypothetical protein